MARKQKTVAIDGYTYALSQLGAVEGRELVVLFVKVLGRFAPLIVSATKAGKVEGGAESRAIEIAEEIGAAIQTLHPKELDPLWDAFARHAYVLSKDGKGREQLSEVFDDHFAGEYFAMVQFFIEAAKLNFGDFLERALGQASASQAADATP